MSSSLGAVTELVQMNPPLALKIHAYQEPGLQQMCCHSMKWSLKQATVHLNIDECGPGQSCGPAIR